MNDITLVIMAAGLGSRYGGIKQIEPVGPNGEIIMSYAVYDAIQTGYDRIVIILRKDIEDDFNKVAGNRLQSMCNRAGIELVYAFQDPYDLPEGIEYPLGRTKPWGTGQAILACRHIIDGPFVVINADDFYARDTLQMMHDFYKRGMPGKKGEFCLAGYTLKNTLSDNGSVTRGVCIVDENNRLTGIKETKGITKYGEGRVGYEDETGDVKYLDPESPVSMNMWGFGPEIIDYLEEGFIDFFKSMKDEPADAETWQKREFLIPIYIGELLNQGRVSVDVLKTNAVWFGVTYKADHELVVDEFKKLTEAGLYPDNMYE